MSRKPRGEALGQDALNELGRAMAEGMEKARVEAWNSALAALVGQLEESAKGGEITTVESCITVAKSLMMGDDE